MGELRRVAGAGDDRSRERARDAGLDGVDLRQRPELVGVPLNDVYGARDGGEVRLDVPRPELRRQPDAVPAPEGRIGVDVMARHASAEVGGEERLTSRLDRPYRLVLDEHVWRDQHQARNPVAGPGVDERYGCTIAVTDEHRLIHTEGIEHLGKHVEGFVVHVANGARIDDGWRLTVAGAGVHQ